MNYIIHYDIAALVLALIIIIHFYHKKSIIMPQTRVFITLIWAGLITVSMDLLSVILEMRQSSHFVMYIVDVVYLIFFNSIPLLYYLYLLLTVRSRDAWKTWDKVVLFVPAGVSIVLIFSSPFTGIIFRYTQEEGYSHGWGFPLLYVAAGVYVAASVFLTVRYRLMMTVWQRVTVYFYILTCILGIILQIILPQALLLQFAVSLTLLLLYMSLEGPNEDEDKLLGIYNRRGFDKVIVNLVGRQKAFHVLVANVTNYVSVRETMGMKFSQMMLMQIVRNLRSVLHEDELFYLNGSELAVVTERSGEEFADLVQNIRQELAKLVMLGDMNIQAETVLLQIDYPDEVTTVEDVMDAVDYSDKFPFESTDDEVLHGSGEILRRKRRENKLIQVMQKALAQKSFEVYYQPIFSTDKSRFNSAEALIRLRDEELGFISPEEFIPIAEKNGMILKIGEFVFRTVCEMMAREKIWEKGIDYIEVNLSVVQCMQEDICEMLYGIMDEYDVPYSAINLEVTETTVAREILWNTMERMTVGGVTFSLDDYGTGYSNLSNILKYPFQIVKLDKSMVWYAMENEFAMRALRHTVAMIRDLSMHIVAEGVETEEQKSVLKEMGCEYLQGYFFSRPVPEKDFLLKIAG